MGVRLRGAGAPTAFGASEPRRLGGEERKADLGGMRTLGTIRADLPWSVTMFPIDDRSLAKIPAE